MTASQLYKTQTRWLFHAHIKLKFSAFWEDSVFDELYSVMADVDAKYNSYTEGSFIDQINRQTGSFVETDANTISLLERLNQLSNALDGEYDITVMPLIRLWGFYKTSGWSVPSQSEIRKAQTLIDYTSIRTKDQQVSIGHGQEIITGSFIKAFAVDEVADHMRKTGISDAIINAGGSSIYTINNESHPYWQIEINDTEDKNKLLFRLQIANQCYSTSANDNTYLEIDGKRYGHIISPKTGYPSENRQVGIISRDALTGDVLSTGLFNFDKDAFRSKINALSKQYDVEGFMVDKNGEIIFSDHFEKYIL